MTQALDSGPNAYDGVYSNCTLEGTGGGAFFDNSIPSYVNLYSAGLAGAFDGNEVIAIVQFKVATADDWLGSGSAYDKKPFTLRVDNNNYLISERGPSRLRWTYRAGGVLYKPEKTNFAPLDWQTQGFYVSRSNGLMSAYLNGALFQNKTLTTTFAGSLHCDTTAIGINSISLGTQPWHGWLRNMILTVDGADISSPDAKHSDIYSKLIAGTLTDADLDTHFGSGKWCWWKLDEV